MLNQAELNFYGLNLNNIIAKENRGCIGVKLRYDANKQTVCCNPKNAPNTMGRQIHRVKRGKKTLLRIFI